MHRNCLCSHKQPNLISVCAAFNLVSLKDLQHWSDGLGSSGEHPKHPKPELSGTKLPLQSPGREQEVEVANK